MVQHKEFGSVLHHNFSRQGIMSNLSLIPLRNNLLKDFRYTEVKSKVIERIQELKLNDGRYKNDAEMLVLICNLLEYMISKKDKLSKKEIAIDILHELFGLTEEDKASISNNIQFLWENRMIKKVSFYKLFKTGLSEWLRKKG